MKIPKNLKGLSRYALIRMVRAQERAIKAECYRCMCISPQDGWAKTKDCGGLHLEKGNCPLYKFRPWGGV